MNQTIITKLFAIPVAVASLIMAYSCSNPEGNASSNPPLIQQVVMDVMPVAPVKTDLTTTTTTTPLSPGQIVYEARKKYGKCGEWHDLAIAIGWPESEWPTLSFVMYRESRCNIGSHNKTDPHSGSRGLMQINGFWCRPNRYDPNGFLQSVGVLKTCDDLFDGETNLRAGLAIWTYGQNKHGCGWRGPWATSCGKITVAEPHPGI